MHENWREKRGKLCLYGYRIELVFVLALGRWACSYESIIPLIH
jgi:hypothetical protein